MKNKNILITGGTGYIGSHTVLELIKLGNSPIILDNYSNSNSKVKDRLEKLTGQKIKTYEDDCRSEEVLTKIFDNHKIDGIIHFAAHKAVGESVENPLKYYSNNINGLISILDASKKYNSKIVFSSSCTVYGTPIHIPVNESTPVQKAESPYGNTKVIGEQIIDDFIKSNSKSSAISLRYFNPIGADKSSKIGELPLGTPNNLVPFITQTAAGIRESLTVFGNDYNTSDGSCIRDYIHVTDLANAHVKSLDYLFSNEPGFHDKFNIGTGKGHSVLELISAFEKISSQKLNYKIGTRRLGDVEAIFGDATKAEKILGWKARIGLEEALLDSWNWQKSLENDKL